MSVFALLCALLVYPDAGWRGELPALERAARRLPASPARDAIVGFCGWAGRAPALAVERAYVESFDFSKRSGLYLSFYAHGDRRQRGAAMLALKHRYAQAGWPLRDGELPDYLPVLLEFADLAPEPGRAVLAELRPAIELVRAALAQAQSPYARVLDALADALGELPDADRTAVERLARDGAPAEQVGLEPFAPPEAMPEPLAHAVSPLPCPAHTNAPRPRAEVLR